MNSVGVRPPCGKEPDATLAQLDGGGLKRLFSGIKLIKRFIARAESRATGSLTQVSYELPPV